MVVARLDRAIYATIHALFPPSWSGLTRPSTPSFAVMVALNATIHAFLPVMVGLNPTIHAFFLPVMVGLDPTIHAFLAVTVALNATIHAFLKKPKNRKHWSG